MFLKSSAADLLFVEKGYQRDGVWVSNWTFKSLYFSFTLPYCRGHLTQMKQASFEKMVENGENFRSLSTYLSVFVKMLHIFQHRLSQFLAFFSCNKSNRVVLIEYDSGLRPWNLYWLLVFFGLTAMYGYSPIGALDYIIVCLKFVTAFNNSSVTSRRFLDKMPVIYTGPFIPSPASQS